MIVLRLITLLLLSVLILGFQAGCMQYSVKCQCIDHDRCTLRTRDISLQLRVRSAAILQFFLQSMVNVQMTQSACLNTNYEGPFEVIYKMQTQEQCLCPPLTSLIKTNSTYTRNHNLRHPHQSKIAKIMKHHLLPIFHFLTCLPHYHQTPKVLD